MTRCHWCNHPVGQGSGVNIFNRGKFQYMECRSEHSCFNNILRQRDALKRVGQQMYNVFFNISQRTEAIHPSDPRVFRDMKEQWEAARLETGF